MEVDNYKVTGFLLFTCASDLEYNFTAYEVFEFKNENFNDDSCCSVYDLDSYCRFLFRIKCYQACSRSLTVYVNS